MRTIFFKGMLLLVSIILIKQLANIVSPAYDKRDVIIAYKTDQLMETGVNMLFLGTSRTKRGVVPAVIDSICPGFHSYNFGENHFAFPYTCKWVEDHLTSLPNLEVLVIELTGVGEKIIDLESWVPYASTSFDPTNGWDYEQKMFAAFRENLMETYLSPLPNMTSFLQGADPSRATADILETFGNTSDLKAPRGNNHNLSSSQVNEYTRRALAAQSTGHANTLAMPQAYRLAIDRLRKQCQRANVQLIFLAPPLFSGEQEVDLYQRFIADTALEGIPVLIINHPLLFEESYRHDYRHFNQPGAQLYSEQLGYVLREILDK